MKFRDITDNFLPGRSRITFGKSVVIIVVGLIIGAASLIFSSGMASTLREKEQYEVLLWTRVLQKVDYLNPNEPLFRFLLDPKNNIPFVILDESFNVLQHNQISDAVVNHPDKLKALVDKFYAMGHYQAFSDMYGNSYFLFYGESKLLKTLVYFPFFQILAIMVFMVFGYLAFTSTKQDEQNRVWIGLAKETAHQLGTPTSSLLGWIEYLRSQPVNQEAVDEMNNDLTRLMKVVDRFSKIGSDTNLTPANVNEVVGNSVLYFKSRIPRNVTLTYNGLAIAPLQALVNTALFEWVIENLLKNSLDALQGKGDIDVNISSDDTWIHIDVSDTGKGIAKNNYKRIFEPGFTTKTRGWGLGLSLSRRIIETYHKGRIFVYSSEPGKGTTIRISLKKYYS